jgi:hypothetical protein
LRQFARRPNRPGNKIATAIRTRAGEHVIGAITAESAFKAAYPGLCGVRRQIAITTFAIRPKFEHAGASKLIQSGEFALAGQISKALLGDRVLRVSAASSMSGIVVDGTPKPGVLACLFYLRKFQPYPASPEWRRSCG